MCASLSFSCFPFVSFFSFFFKIKRYDATQGMHTLHYEDGEVRDSDMSKRGFRVCGRPKQPPPPQTTAGLDATSAGQDAHSSSRKRHVSLAPCPPAEYAPDTSAYVIAALNRFGEAGGMAPLAQRLSSGRAPFNEVLETFRLAKALRTHASSRSMKEVNWTLKECAAGALLSVAPESMRATTKADIAECVSSVKDLALTGSGAKGAANPPLVLVQELEQLELGMAMKVCATVFCFVFWALGAPGELGVSIGRGRGPYRRCLRRSVTRGWLLPCHVVLVVAFET